MCHAKKCFCISLRTGTIAIGCFYAITAVIGLIICLAYLNVGVVPTAQDVDSKLSRISGRERTTVYFSGAIFASIQLLMALSVIYGSYSERPGCLIPWLIYAVICFISTKAAVIYYTVKYFSRYKPMTGLTGLSVLSGLMFAMSAFVVYSYKNILQEKIDSKKLEEETSVTMLT